MLIYFDKVFIRIYNQYIKWKEKDIPGVYAILLISLFQTLNIFVVVSVICGLINGRDWSISKLDITALSIAVLGLDYLRIYRIKGVENLLNTYDSKDSLKVPIHPVLYFVLSLAAIAIVRLIGLWPRSIT